MGFFDKVINLIKLLVGEMFAWGLFPKCLSMLKQSQNNFPLLIRAIMLF